MHTHPIAAASPAGWCTLCLCKISSRNVLFNITGLKVFPDLYLKNLIYGGQLHNLQAFD